MLPCASGEGGTQRGAHSRIFCICHEDFEVHILCNTDTPPLRQSYAYDNGVAIVVLFKELHCSIDRHLKLLLHVHASTLLAFAPVRNTAPKRSISASAPNHLIRERSANRIRQARRTVPMPHERTERSRAESDTTVFLHSTVGEQRKPCDKIPFLRTSGNGHHNCLTQCSKGATAMTISRPAAS